MKRKEIHSLTGLRGIAALMVMFYHFNGGYAGPGIAYRMLGHCYLMVDLFLVLSGFILAMTYGKRFEKKVTIQAYRLFIRRRFARIYPLYALMTILAIILIIAGWMAHWPISSISVAALLNCTMLQSLMHTPTLVEPGWSVSAEWIASMLFPFFALLLLERSWKWTILAGFIAFISLPIISYVPALHEVERGGLLNIWSYKTIYPVVRCLADFLLGVVIFRASKLTWVQYLISRTWIAPVLFCIILLLFAVHRPDLWIVALFPFLVLSLLSNTNIVAYFLGSKVICRLGQISYSIYLIHTLLNYPRIELTGYLETINIGSRPANILAIFVFAVVAIVLAEISYRYIEQPARNYINNLATRK